MTDTSTQVSSTKYLKEIGPRARAASKLARKALTRDKNQALSAIAEGIRSSYEKIKNANTQDLSRATSLNKNAGFIDRLTVRDSTLEAMISGLLTVSALPDPVGCIHNLQIQPSGIQVGQMRVPIGVIGMIYEARPNVTIEAAALCIKSANALILRGGAESIETNKVLAEIVRKGLQSADLPQDIVQLVDSTDRTVVDELISHPEWIDVIIPRGGKALIERITANAKVPVIKHLEGICHVYIDSFADINQAIQIADNAKTQRYAPCNTMETLLVARDIAENVLPLLCQIYQQKGVELRADPEVAQILLRLSIPYIAATDEDWTTEYMAPILSIRVVGNLDEAIEHISRYGSQHTDAIVTQNYNHAMRFIREVDSSSVLINASTRLSDGFEFGLGAEIGISTNKLHARGPVGLDGLTCLKFVVFGDGNIRQ